MIRIPSTIHVDPNMHPSLYERLPVFPLLFDEVSVWAFSANLFQRYSALLSVEEFKRLVSAGAVTLSAATDFYTKERRATLPPQLGWTDFDSYVVETLKPAGRLLAFDGGPTMRNRAWDLADQLGERAEKELGRQIWDKPSFAERTLSKPEELSIAAYQRAIAAFDRDAAAFEEQTRNRSGDDLDSAKFDFRGILPPIFFQAKKDDYRIRLRHRKVLPCLYFDHFTKAQIVSSLNAKYKRNFQVYVPPEWHDLMANGISAVSTSGFFGPQYGLRTPELGKLTSPLLDAFAGSSRSGDDDLVELILTWRRVGGPAWLRRRAEEHLLLAMKNGATVYDWASALRQSLRDELRGLLERAGVVSQHAIEEFMKWTGRAATHLLLVVGTAHAVELLVHGGYSPEFWRTVSAHTAEISGIEWFLENKSSLTARLLKDAWDHASGIYPEAPQVLVNSWLNTVGGTNAA